MSVKKRKGRKPLPEGEKKVQISMSFYMHPKDIEQNGGEETIKEVMHEHFNTVYGKG